MSPSLHLFILLSLAFAWKTLRDSADILCPPEICPRALKSLFTNYSINPLFGTMTFVPLGHASTNLVQNGLFFSQVTSEISPCNAKHIKVSMNDGVNDAPAAKNYAFVSNAAVSLAGNMEKHDLISTKTPSQSETEINETAEVFELEVIKGKASYKDIYELSSTSFLSRVLTEYHEEMPDSPTMEPEAQTAPNEEEEEEEKEEEEDLTEREQMLQYVRRCGVYGLVMRRLRQKVFELLR